MKRILISLMTIAIVAVVGFAVTRAYFSDTETSTGNKITAGTIDIAVDGENPWSKTYSETLGDMKPSQVRWVDFTIQNVGENPVVVWKQIHVTGTSTGIESEPECTVQGGVWDNTAKACDWDGGGTMMVDKNDLDNVTTYDMKVNGEVLIDGAWNVKISGIDSVWVPLGRIEPGEEMTVSQSYHIMATAGNEYQGDEMTFNINLYAEQLLGTGPGSTADGLVLENKDGNWNQIIDGRWGLLTWDGVGAFDFNGHGLNDVNYSLIYYPEPQTTWPWPVTVITNGTAIGGELTLTGTLPALSNAKIWLVESGDVPGGNMTGWTPANYLFESNLITAP